MAIKTNGGSNVFSDIDIRKLETHTTDVGTLVMGYIAEPSYTYDEAGQYFVKLSFPVDSPEAKRLAALIDTEQEEFYEYAVNRKILPANKIKKASPSYTYEVDENNNPVNLTINFKHKATYLVDGETKYYTLKVFDSVGQPIKTDGLQIWGGSKIAVAFKLIPFYTPALGIGISNRLLAVQVVKAVAQGSMSAESYGFTKHKTVINEDVADTVKANEGTDGDENDF